MTIDNKVQTVQTTRRVGVDVISCDFCGAEAVKAQVVLQSEVVVPKGSGTWYAAAKIDLADDSPISEVLHFCSRDCLNGYLDGEPEPEAEPEPDATVTSSSRKAREAVAT